MNLYRKVLERAVRMRTFISFMARLCVVLLLLINASCAYRSAVDKPLAQWTPELDERAIQRLDDGGRSPDHTVLVAFSGGGTRASAFAYGVLKELAETELTITNAPSTLLKEVDAISSVSGGSFTSAYYGLYGEKIFTDFEPHFLRKDVEGLLFWKLFNPFDWVRLLSRSFSRSDLVAEYYDKDLFHGATFADLQRPGAPMVIINATDLATGNRFSFVEGTFSLLCAELSSYPLSHAVAASSAVPVVLSPITLESFAGSCGYQPPAWQAEALKDKEPTLRRSRARRFQEYLDREKHPWLHLVDGGISDNLGLRSFYEALALADKPDSLFHKVHLPKTKHILIISVNAHAQHRSNWILKSYAPSLLEVIGSLSADQITRYSEDTIQLVRYNFNQWAIEKSTPERPVTFHFVEVSFDQVRDDGERDFLNSIGTNFDLSDEQVDRLIAAARKVLRESKDFQAFIEISQRDM
jgi:NTE family protein